MTGQRFQDLGLQATNGGGCACCGPASHATTASTTAPATAQPASGDLSAQFLVEGMTCSHCVRSVTEEVSAIDGVSGVEVDLHPGGVSTVTVSSTAPVDAERVREAVEEAGYSLAATS
ncbi:MULTISPECIES: heavy-metal-associated domain-containing protein [unclassified Microbacterium]|uniref:heavy-metal-associated domain-containing protein n=1 Tax=unclassified Microbacterium TaxID=2609290 RepID=UPI0021A7FA4F|nr:MULTISPECIES: heavy-metal-associated domain-containing protein [unclassified Microbacterium]MCT1478750.1 heavy-metal-associated domain-containing protein [Microbacterium sp. p3-SID336]MDI9889579.1 heavy-metal-associated domain-containing protein [Microbacterium sp. IEGM 1404]